MENVPLRHPLSPRCPHVKNFGMNSSEFICSIASKGNYKMVPFGKGKWPSPGASYSKESWQCLCPEFSCMWHIAIFPKDARKSEDSPNFSPRSDIDPHLSQGADLANDYLPRRPFSWSDSILTSVTNWTKKELWEKLPSRWQRSLGILTERLNCTSCPSSTEELHNYINSLGMGKHC